MNERTHTGLKIRPSEQDLLKEEKISTDRLISGIYRQALVADDLSIFFSECLRTIGESLGVSRIFLYEYREDSLVLKSIHEWTEDRLTGEKDRLINIPKAKVPWWMNTITNNEIIKFSDVDMIPAAFERRVLKRIGIKSLLAVPLYLSKRFYGFLGIADNRRHRLWEDDVTEIIKLAAQIMTGVLGGAGVLGGVHAWNKQPGRDANTGQCFVAINPEFFLGLEAFKKTAGEICRQLRASRKAPGAERIYTAGEKEYLEELKREKEGVPIPEALQGEMIQMRDELGLSQYRFAFEAYPLAGPEG